MALELIQLDASSVPQISALLLKQFSLTPEHPLLDREQILWKYFEPRPDWDGSRSYGLMSGGRMLAHAAVCPIHFTRPVGEAIRTALVIDWVSGVPGAGTEIFKRFYTMFDAIFGESGSSRAQKIIQLLGFPKIGEVKIYSRPLRPLDLFRQRAGNGVVRNLARFGRDVVANAMPAAKIPEGWMVERVSASGDRLERICAYEPASFRQPKRSPALVSYFLKCPGVRMTGYSVRHNGVERAYFLLGDLKKEVRLADLRIASEEQLDWTATIALLLRVAQQEYSAALLIVPSSLPLLDEALENNRFRCFQHDPMYLYDPQALFPNPLSVNMTPFDGDQAYM